SAVQATLRWLIQQDDVIAIPVTTAINLFNTKGLVEIDIIAKSPELLPQAVKEIKSELGRDISSDDFHVDTQEGMMSMINNIIGVLTSVIGGIAAISLLVGGIGIMNIMLVSVTERTKEIGIRKAVGARKRDIFAQFLVESVVVSFLGGIGGIILGLGGTFLIMYIIKLGMVVVVWALTLACSVSIAIGVISGVYPAMRAVNLDPIEALRYE
ncbi:MAG: FtsX-like permease family protein, partial [Candidatus Margulisiibacteriota bacterium]